MTYKLLKDWPSKRHGKTIKQGTFVVITEKGELEQLVELGCIPKQKEVKEVKEKKKKKN